MKKFYKKIIKEDGFAGSGVGMGAIAGTGGLGGEPGVPKEYQPIFRKKKKKISSPLMLKFRRKPPM